MKNAAATGMHHQFTEMKPENNLPFFERLKQNITRKAGITFINFKAHLALFGCSCLFLFILNMLIPSRIPWFYLIVSIWATGIILHSQHVWNMKKEQEQLSPVKDISPNQIALIRRIQKSESAFRHQRTLYACSIIFFFGINLITGLTAPWFLLPMMAWGTAFGIYWAFYRGEKKFLGEELSETGISWIDIKKQKGTMYASLNPGSEYREKHIEVIQIKDRLLALLAGSRNPVYFSGMESREFLSVYISRIDQLIENDTSLDRLLKDIPEEEIDKALLSLKTKTNQTDDGVLRTDYRKLIEYHERKKKYIHELKKKRELIHAKTNHAIALLGQMELDLTKLKNVAVINPPSSFAQLEQASSEIGQYLDDLGKEKFEE